MTKEDYKGQQSGQANPDDSYAPWGVPLSTDSVLRRLPKSVTPEEHIEMIEGETASREERMKRELDSESGTFPKPDQK